MFYGNSAGYSGFPARWLKLNQYACIDAAAGEIVGDAVAVIFCVGNPIVGVHVIDAQKIEGIKEGVFRKIEEQITTS